LVGADALVELLVDLGDHTVNPARDLVVDELNPVIYLIALVVGLLVGVDSDVEFM